MQKIQSSRFLVAGSKNGLGVFAKKNFAKGKRLIRFTGPIYTYDQLPPDYQVQEGHFVQIGKNTEMGPSGGIDDYFNHSCDPNAGLIVSGQTVWLIAIKQITAGEEITFDYSTTMDGDDWEIACNCGTARCRKRISNFSSIPNEIQKHYIRLGIVPEYIYPRPSTSRAAKKE